METSGTLCMHAIDFGFYIYLLIMICEHLFFLGNKALACALIYLCISPFIFIQENVYVMYFTIYFYKGKYVMVTSS